MLTTTTQCKINEPVQRYGHAEIKSKQKDLFSRPPKILLIESESATQKMHVQCLESLGCEVITVTSGKDFPDKCRDKFDLMFVDTLLPDMNGLMICGAIRAKYHSLIPIVVLARNKSLRKEDCDWLTLNEVISKPLTMIDLKEILQRVLPKLLLSELEADNYA